MPRNKLVIYYDGDCPFCRNYVHFLNMRNNYKGEVSLFNAREFPEKVEYFNAKGFPLNDGMIVEMNEEYYYGSDAVWLMSLLSSQNSLMHFINRNVFKSRNISRLIYPFLKFGRMITLKLLGKKPL